MFNETELSTVFLTVNHAKAVAAGIKEGRFEYLRNIVIMDEQNWTEELKAECAGENVTTYTLAEVIEAGKKEIHELPKVTPDDVALFSYTSGTTGKPKGAMVSHRNLAAAVAGLEPFLPI